LFFAEVKYGDAICIKEVVTCVEHVARFEYVSGWVGELESNAWEHLENIGVVGGDTGGVEESRDSTGSDGLIIFRDSITGVVLSGKEMN
jgi:hypothetical protein